MRVRLKGVAVKDRDLAKAKEFCGEVWIYLNQHISNITQQCTSPQD